MSNLPFDRPEPGSPISRSNGDDNAVFNFLSNRRSVPIKTFDANADGPDDELLSNLLTSALRVPDHRNVQPWRLLIIKGNEREALGKILADRHQSLNPDATLAELELERNRPMRGPVCVCVISSPDTTHKTPVWEQELSTGAVCLNILYMCRAAGFDSSWISEWWAFDEVVDRALGLDKGERIAGHIFIGQSSTNPVERNRGDLAAKIGVWTSD